MMKVLTHNIQQEREDQRDRSAQLFMWCIVVSMHQDDGIGASRLLRACNEMDAFEKKYQTAILYGSSKNATDAMRENLKGICDFEVRLPVDRAPRGRREEQLRMASNQGGAPEKKGWNDMKQSEKLTQLLELMQANPELPVVPCVDGDVVGGDEYYCWLGSWGESAIQEFIIGKERTYYREDDICEMNDVLYERYDPELVDNMTDEETRAAYNALPWKKAIFVDVHQYEEEPDAEV